MTTNPVLAGLNEQQLAAVTAPAGPALVLAGPGSGKTRVLTHRIAYLLSELGVPPWQVLAVTFTNKAAREMRERLDLLVGPYSARALTVGTFHATCARILRRDGALVGLDPHFTIYDDDDQLRLIKQAISEEGLDEKQYPGRSILTRIGFAKNNLLGPTQYPTDSYFDEIVARVYRRYQALLEKNNAADFDDLLVKVVRLWSEHPAVLEHYRDRWRWVLVDEYQDTNHAQYLLVKLLTSGHRNLFVVGDEDQGIYSWRSADIRNIMNFERDFPEARVILLEQNYRSTQAILDVATNVITGNSGRRPKALWTDRAGGVPVEVREAYDERDEARYVASEIRRLRAAEGYGYGDFAVMYRTNAQSRVIEQTLNDYQYRIPYQLVGGTRFFERKEVKDVLAYLRLVHNPRDRASLLRVIENTPSGRGVGPRTLQALEGYADRHGLSLWETIEMACGLSSPPLAVGEAAPAVRGEAKTSLRQLVETLNDVRENSRHQPLPQLIDAVVSQTGYALMLTNLGDEGLERLENVRELEAQTQEYAGLDPSEALTQFLESVSLESDADTMRGSEDAVTLITLHAAKGLEFKVVFIVGMEENLLPHSRSLDNPQAVEEECRLAYVGVTRAMERLYLSYAFHRNVFGGVASNAPSRFLGAIPQELVSGRVPSPESARRTISGLGLPRAPQPESGSSGRWSVSVQANGSAPDFRQGDRVRHEKFGEGEVVAANTQSGELEVEVRFDSGSVKRLLASIARMEKV